MANPNIDELVNSELAPKFVERKSKHLNERDSARASGRLEGWPVRGISYGGGITRDEPKPLTINGVVLEGMESVIYWQVMSLLAEKERNPVEMPVIALDFGGMYGLPFIKLAKATEESVRQSKLVYVISNLLFNPSKLSDCESLKGLNYPEYDDFFLQNKNQVHYLVLDAEELRTAKVNLQNGRCVPLFGNIDLIHENNALGKSQLLDLDLLLLGNSLSPYGVFFLGDNDPNNTVNPIAFKIGKRKLLRSGVDQIDFGATARYDVYARPKAPTSFLRFSQS
ncbi:MAG: hypothetical protein Q7K43_00790 [Candidatus Woesearchaeota archaeon]|nr:hypothetical protein [Candidatus Woesearchaeota archaeon]